MSGKIWSIEEDSLLKNSYQYKKQDLIKLFPNRSADAVMIRACLLGLKKERNEYIEGDLSVLLNNCHESYYWIGFIYADGSIVKERLKISLAIKDYNHLDKFCQFVKHKSPAKYLTNINKKYCSVAIQDKYYVPKIKIKFDFKQAKTYNPPQIITENFELLLSLFIGYIDGDGSIIYQSHRTDCLIKIQIHSSWLEWLKYFHNQIQQKLNISFSPPYINSRGYAYWNIARKTILIDFKKHITTNQLPILERKWDKIMKGAYHE